MTIKKHTSLGFIILTAILLLASCTKTEKWRYEKVHPNDELIGAGYSTSAYLENTILEIIYKDNLVTIKEVYTSTAHAMRRHDTTGGKMGSIEEEGPVEAKLNNSIIGPCQYIDTKNWKCGTYQMFSGVLRDKNGRMFKE